MSGRRFDLGDVVQNVGTLARWLLPWDATLTLDVAPGPVPIQADRSLVVRLLHDLVHEAADAMSPGGAVTLRLRHDEEGRVALLEIYDAGPGIAGSYERMTVVQAIERERGWSAAIDRSDGEGATVRITLPIAAAGRPRRPTERRRYAC